MPIKNLVSDFGAVGDGQRQTLNITVASGSGVLTIVGATPFNPATIAGKTISVWNGSSFKSGVVQASPTPTSSVVTLSGTFSWSITNSSADVLWGTDNSNSFTGASGSWRAYARTQTNPADIPILEIPDGSYLLNVGAGVAGLGGAMHVGVLNSAKIRGQSGVAANCTLMNLANGEMRLGHNVAIAPRAGLTNIGGNSVRLQTGAQGSNTVTLVAPAGTDLGGSTYGSRVVVGRACLLAAFDMQSLNDSDYGYPPNSFYTEWNKITAYNSGTGVVTLETPLTQTYKSTFPQWGKLDTSFGNGGTQGSDQGGPFTMWIADAGFENTITLEDFTIDDPHNQSAASVRYLTCNRLVMTGFGLYPTQADIIEMNSCVYPNSLEVDKMVNQVTWNNCTLSKLQQQSASPNKMILNGGSIGALETARYTEANNVAITNVFVGCSGYGRTERVILNNCSVASIQRAACLTADLGGTNAGGVVNADTFYDFSTGVMRFLKTRNDAGAWNTNVGQQNPTRFFMPGTWVTFDDRYIDQITDVTDDGTYINISFANTTAWPFTPVSRIRCHPCPDWTVINCTGADPQLEDFNAAQNRKPIYSYSKRSIVAGASGTTVNSNYNATLLGRLVSETLTVSTPYIGAGTLTFKDSQFLNRTYVKRSDQSVSATYGNTIDMKVGGVRVVRAATTPTGKQTNDTLMDMTTPGEANFTGAAAAGTIFNNNVSNGETPTITVEYVMDQGIPSLVPTAVAPLRLRLRG